METVLYISSFVVALYVLRLALLAWASMHADASISRYRAVGADGVERDAMSFGSSHDNTLVGRTLGRWYIRIAERKYMKAERQLTIEQGN